MEAKLTYTILEAAKALGIGKNVAYEAVASGKIPSIRMGKRRILIPKAALDRMLVGAADD